MLTDCPICLVYSLFLCLSITICACIRLMPWLSVGGVCCAAPVAPGHGTDALAVWHVAVILTELASLPPMPRVDKAKLFGLLLARYSNLVRLLDSKLEELLLKAGEASFGYQSPQAAQQGVNPMALLQGMLGGGGAAGGAGAGAGGVDMAGMMDMMQRMQANGRR